MLHELLGPGSWDRWVHWKYATPEQTSRSAIKYELDKIIHANDVSLTR